MDDLPRAVGEVQLSDLECPVCMEYMVPPIKLCTNGHNICSKCRQRVQRCPTCRAEFLETRNVALENIVRRQKYPCANRQRGCLDRFSIEHIAKHHAGCVYGKIKCPFHLIKTCSWNGLKNDLKEHAKSTHPKYFWEGSTFTFPLLSAQSFATVSLFGELFTYFLQKRNGRCYAAVQLIGTSSEASKYKCVFTLRAANGIEQISKTFLVQGYSENFETIFNSGKCLNLDEETFKSFDEGNNLKLTITLSKVE
jgi:E3 ubiquitin-protein ligase SIAH1